YCQVEKRCGQLNSHEHLKPGLSWPSILPPDIIFYAVWRYHRFCLSFHDVEALLAQHGMTAIIRPCGNEVQSSRQRSLRGFSGARGDWLTRDISMKCVLRGDSQCLCGGVRLI